MSDKSLLQHEIRYQSGWAADELDKQIEEKSGYVTDHIHKTGYAKLANFIELPKDFIYFGKKVPSISSDE